MSVCIAEDLCILQKRQEENRSPLPHSTVAWRVSGEYGQPDALGSCDPTFVFNKPAPSYVCVCTSRARRAYIQGSTAEWSRSRITLLLERKVQQRTLTPEMAVQVR